MGKRDDQIAHARRRMRERFGLRLSEHDVTKIIRQIQDQSFTCLERQSGRITVWKGVVHEIPMILVYDSQRKALVTAMTPEMWDYNKGARTNFW